MGLSSLSMSCWLVAWALVHAFSYRFSSPQAWAQGLISISGSFFIAVVTTWPTPASTRTGNPLALRRRPCRTSCGRMRTLDLRRRRLVLAFSRGPGQMHTSTSSLQASARLVLAVASRATLVADDCYVWAPSSQLADMIPKSLINSTRPAAASQSMQVSQI